MLNRALPEWQKFTEEAAFKNTFMSGKQYVDWVSNADMTHRTLTLVISIAVPVAIFLLFEIWFLVLLPKGPVEHLLGY